MVMPRAITMMMCMVPVMMMMAAKWTATSTVSFYDVLNMEKMFYMARNGNCSLLIKSILFFGLLQ
jgi:hypothetical protein